MTEQIIFPNPWTLGALLEQTALVGSTTETAGNFSRQAHTRLALVTVTGPGGPSGGARANNDRAAMGEAGGAGGTVQRVYTRAELSDANDQPLVIPYVLGARGDGGDDTGTGGSGNTDSTFGTGVLASVLTGETGEAGAGQDRSTGKSWTVTSRALGGRGLGGDANLKGQDGGWGHAEQVYVAPDFLWLVTPSQGGASFYGGGSVVPGLQHDSATGKPQTSQAGQSGVTIGAGASGAWAIGTTQIGAAGNRGGPAMIVIHEFA